MVPQNLSAGPKGVSMMFHFVKGIKPFSRVKVQATLYEGTLIVKQENLQDCNWATTSIDTSQQQFAPKGSSFDIAPNG